MFNSKGLNLPCGTFGSEVGISADGVSVGLSWLGKSVLFGLFECGTGEEAECMMVMLVLCAASQNFARASCSSNVLAVFPSSL